MLKDKLTDASPKSILKLGLLTILAFFVIIGGPFLFEDVANDEIIVNQFPITGTVAVWTEPGIQFQGAGNTERYPKAFQFWFGSGKQGEARKITYSEGGKGFVFGSVRIILPRDKAAMMKIQSEFGSLERIQTDLIATTINKVVLATGPLLSSYESYSERRNDILNLIEDQLRYGVYKTNVSEKVIIDNLTGEKRIIKQAYLIPSTKPEDMGYQRQENAPFAAYKLDLAQLSIDDLTYDEDVTDQIKAQQKAYMAVQTAIAEVKTAEQNALKEEALGKASVAKARADQNVVKEKAVVEAEKDKEVATMKAQQLRDVARLEKEAAAFYKDKQILEGQGDAERKRLAMQSDGALAQKLDAWVKVNEAYAKALGEYQGNWVPTVVSGGNGSTTSSNGAINMIEMLAVKAAKDLALDMSVKKTSKTSSNNE